MSFGYSVSDAVLLVQLAWKTVQNSRKACGEHDELTQEISSLHVVLRRLELEVRMGDSPINRPEDTCQQELQIIASGCQKVLDALDKLLEKYNTLGTEGKGAKKLWQRIRFGNGEMIDLGTVRGKLIYYTSALSLFLDMVTMASMGRVEKHMDEAGGDLKDIKLAVNGIAGLLVSKSHNEGSLLTAYGDDDRLVWKEFRRELLKDGFSSSVLHKHKSTIKAYVTELGERGLFDEEDTHLNDSQEYHARSMNSVDHVNRVTSLPLGTVTKLDYTEIATEDIVKTRLNEPLVREVIGQGNTEARTHYKAGYDGGADSSITRASASLARASPDTAALPTLNSAPGDARPDLSPSGPGELRENQVLDVGNAGTDCKPRCERLMSAVIEQRHKPILRNEELFMDWKSLRAMLERRPLVDNDDLRRTLRLYFKPQCERLILQVTDQMKKSIFPNEKHFLDERKRLSKCFGSNIHLTLDRLDVGYDHDLTVARKNLIQEVQTMLTALDISRARISSITHVDIVWHHYHEQCAPHCVKRIMSKAKGYEWLMAKLLFKLAIKLVPVLNADPVLNAEGLEIRRLLWALKSANTTNDPGLQKLAQQLEADMDDMLKIIERKTIASSYWVDMRSSKRRPRIGKGERIFLGIYCGERWVSFQSGSKCPYDHDAASTGDVLNIKLLNRSFRIGDPPEFIPSRSPVLKSSRNRRAPLLSGSDIVTKEDVQNRKVSSHSTKSTRYGMFEEEDDWESETESSSSHSRHRSSSSGYSESESSDDSAVS